MNRAIEQLVSSLSRRRQPGAPDDAIHRLLVEVKQNLPEDYLEFLRVADGAEGFLTEEHYLMLFSIDEVIANSRSYRELVPWLLFFGSTGSIGGYAFDLRSDPMPVLEVDWIGLDLNPMYYWGAHFREFLENLASGREPKELDTDDLTG